MHTRYGLLMLLCTLVISACGNEADTAERSPETDTLASESSETDTTPDPSTDDLYDDGLIRSATMEAWANEYAAGLGELPEYPGFLDLWTPYAGDIDGDGDVDSVGVFGMSSGGNGIMSHVAVFTTEGERLSFDAVVNVGWIGDRAVNEIVSIADGKIDATVALWKETDGRCCPSDSGMIELRWEPGSLEVVE